MSDIIVKATSHTYRISVGENIRFKLEQYLMKEYTSVMIITDDNVAPLYLDDIINNFSNTNLIHTVIPAGEQSKDIDTFYKLQTEAIKNGLDRQSLIIALGGGVVGDLAGFVAATYMRGVDYIHIPTTILAHDSSVGGKVAINHARGKNMIGNFYPPRAVVYDVETLQTLSKSEVRSGYAELIKEALIADESFFNALLETKLTDLSNEKLEEHLRLGINIKAKIVESDEKEAGIRMYLNLGHTLGHALEAELGYGVLTHGEAIALGLLFAFRLSESVYNIKLPYDALLEWLEKNDYPLYVPKVSTDNLMNIMKSDKKVVNNKIKMILLKNVAEPVIVEVSHDVLQVHLQSFIEELVEK